MGVGDEVQVVRKVTTVDFEMEMPGKRRKKKIYHANFLKKWHTQRAHQHSWSCTTLMIPLSKLLSTLMEMNK